MTQQTTKALREEYLTAKTLASMDIREGNPDTKFQREGAKNGAISRLPQLQASLLSRITQDSVTVIVTEEVSPTETLKQLESENDNVTVLGLKDIDRLIGQLIYPKDNEAGYPINPEFVSRLNSLIAGEVAYQIGAEYMPSVKPSATLYGVAKTREDMLKKLSIMLKGAYGTELNRIYLTKRVNEEIFNRIKNDKIIVIVTEVPLDLVKEISKLTGRTAVLTSTSYPGSIKFDADMNAGQLKAAIAKAVSASNKKTNVNKT